MKQALLAVVRRKQEMEEAKNQVEQDLEVEMKQRHNMQQEIKSLNKDLTNLKEHHLQAQQSLER